MVCKHLKLRPGDDSMHEYTYMYTDAISVHSYLLARSDMKSCPSTLNILPIMIFMSQFCVFPM